MTDYTRSVAGEPSQRCKDCSHCMATSYGGVIMRVFCSCRHNVSSNDECQDRDVLQGVS